MPTPAQIFAKLSKQPMGRRLFTWAVCRKAPYFASIQPLVQDLKIGRCEVRMAKRRAVQNHIGTVHAIAMCNLCEMAGGLMIDSSLPKALRWIPKGMTVRYLRKAETDLVAVAEWTPDLGDDYSGDVVLTVRVRDTAGTVVMEADISMYVSPKPAAARSTASKVASVNG